MTYRVLRVDPDADQHWRTLRDVGARLLAGRHPGALRASAGSSSTCRCRSASRPCRPTAPGTPPSRFVTNTNWQWYSGEAADRPPDADVRPDRAELRLRRRRHGRRRGLRPRPGPHPRATAGSATSGPTWSAPSLRVLLPISLVAAVPAGRCSARSRTSLEPQTVHDAHRRRPGTSPAARWPARRRSRSSAPTAAASTTSTPRTRSRTRRRSPTCSRSSCSCVIPFSMAWAFGLIVGDRRQGGAVLAVMALLLGDLGRAADLGGDGRPRHRPGSSPAARWRARRSGSARRPRRCSAPPRPGTSTGAVNSMHDSLTAPGGGVAMFNMMLGEIAPGGVGSGPLRHADAGRRHRVPRRPDGRPHAGVPRQEDRPARDRAGRALRPGHAGPAC